MKNRLFAWINLAYRFAVHVLWRLPRRALGWRGDYTRFSSTTTSEGFRPLQAAERTQFPEFMQCIHCGLCSLSCPELRAAPESAWEETWTFVAGPARSLERATLVAPAMTPCAECSECAAVCPTGVPIAQLAATIRRMATMSDERRATSDE
jgi:succinate dehydrogenase/fumarate reductase-like Fe-S protein